MNGDDTAVTGCRSGSGPDGMAVRERLPEYGVLVDGGRTVTLVGAPRQIWHELEFHNEGDERAILRQASFHCPQVEESTGRRPGVVMPTVVLRPGHARRVRIRIVIPTDTPPGSYEGELAVAGGQIPTVLHVVEDVELEVAPAEVVLESGAGERVDRQIVCTNHGNVPLVVGEIGAVVLDDELTTCRSLRAVTAAWPDEGGEHDAVDRFVDLYVKEGWKKVVEHSGVLRVHTRGGPQEIPPGETRVVVLEITLPDRLEPRTRYTAVAPLYTTDLTFRVVPVRGRPDSAGGQRAPDGPARRTDTTTTNPSRSRVPAKKTAAKRATAPRGSRT